ncbi:hypothetical protein AAES_15613 [Amazona aestiva]|uniref:Reverse transcriptase/retrotransposon-derived protein RNase H-like domain-containing protein n=1 Tax=Amazona aestiva TaxID=12930 RepID=A0A0Q3X8Q6_AMAAE|nr:hypothetical protein AAES_15613 [Amazona aestiva]
MKETFPYVLNNPTRLFTASFESCEGFEWPLGTLETCLLIVMGITMLAQVQSVLPMTISSDLESSLIQFLGIKWQDGCHQILTVVINKITAMSPPTNKKETQAFLGAVGFWRMHIPNYSLIASPLYYVTQKKNDFKWGPEQQQAFEQIKRQTVHAVAQGPVRTGPDVKLYCTTQLGRMVLPGASGRKLQGRLEVDPSAFGIRDTEDLRPAIPQLK